MGSSSLAFRKAFRKPVYGWRRFGRDLVIDALLVLLSLGLAHWLTYPKSQAVHFDTSFAVEAFVLVIATLAVLLWRGVYNINPRYFGLNDFLGIGIAGLLVSLLQLALPVTDGDPRRMIARTLVFGFTLTASLAAVRIVLRVRSWRRISGSDAKMKRTLIVGAGDAGEMISREIQRGNHPVHRVVGFVDDNPAKASLFIDRIPVLGTCDQIPELAREHKIEEIFIAIPSAKGEHMRRLMSLCQKTDSRVKTLPPLHSLMGPQMTTYLREVEVEDLLRRETVKTDVQGIAKYLGGERILITGAGGSIGAELARQIAGLSPASLILLGKGENSIYEIEQELLRHNGFQAACVIADVRDRASMEAAFDRHRPTVVFHAAAHKHVPLMEGNPIEAIRNNVLGTWLVAELSVKYGARRLIYVSTDKAVHPSSVMGATKRVGEMIVTSYRRRTETDCAIVRFGNVMGSRGSLIPMLKLQIKRGGPVRITHAEMTRYFMTIPEAVQLILQAGALGEQGEIFLLEMGEPVKILDLASDLIRLHGLVPGKDIELQFTGMRPGEKLHEELVYATEELSPTLHPKIQMVRRAEVSDWDLLKEEIEGLLWLCSEGKAEEARHFLMELAWGKSVAGTPGIGVVQVPIDG